MNPDSFVTWAAPIASTVLTTYLVALISRADKRTEEKRSKELEWRDSVDVKLEELAKGINDVDDKTRRSIAVQAAQIRSDIIHKCHRYLDDLGRASTEEKEALSDEHEQYARFCADLDVENNFIDALVERVMNLPEREV